MSDDPYTVIEKQALRDYIPLKATLELTYRCNFRCVMCYLVEFRSPGELSTEEFMNVMDQLADMGCMTLTFTGGEPLLRRDFFELAAHARKRRFALRIFSNGSLIDEDVADRLLEIQPISVEISMYGASDATYEVVTAQRSRLSQVKNGIRMLRDRELPVKIKLPVLKKNVADLDAIEAFADEVGAGLAANPNITPKDNGDFSPLSEALDDHELVEYYRRYPPNALKPMEAEGLMCNTARSAVVVSPLGDVFPCVQIKRSVGNVRERPLQDIWSHAPLLDELRALRVRDYKGCGSCGSSGGLAQCAGVAKQATGSFTGGDPLAERLARLREVAR